MTKTLKRVTGIFLAISLSIDVSFLQAQNPPPEQRQDEAAVIERKIKEEAEQRLVEKKAPPQIEEEKREEKPPLAAGPKFFVKEIRLEGNAVISTAELAPLIYSYENKEVAFRDLSRLARQIESAYREKGFVTSTAYIPEQRLEGGVCIIRIVEGKVGEFQVEGNRFFRRKRIMAYMPVKKGEILQYKKIRKGISRVNRNPDRQVRAILRKGAVPETTDVTLKVKDHLPLHAGFLFDNQGTESTGKKRFGFTLQDNNLSSLDDILSGGIVFGEHFGAIFSQYALPIPQIGTRLLAGFSHAQVSPKKDLEAFGVNGTSETYYGKAEQPLFENERLSFNLSSGFEFKESRTKVLSGTFRRERLRILRLEPRFEVKDWLGNTQIGSEFSFGLNTLGAAVHIDPSSARQGVEPDFFRMTANLTRNQKMPFKTRSVLKTKFQLPSTKLPSSETFFLGGADTVRGYPEGDYLGDSGFLLSFEYVSPSFFIPKDWQLPRAKMPLRNQIELVFFMDEGYGRLRGPSAREVPSRHLLGSGGGLRIRLYKNLYARIEAAHALGHEPLTESEHTRLYFRLQAEL